MVEEAIEMNKHQASLAAASDIFTSAALMSKRITATARALAIEHNEDLESALRPDVPKLPKHTPMDTDWQRHVYGSGRKP